MFLGLFTEIVSTELISKTLLYPRTRCTNNWIFLFPRTQHHFIISSYHYNSEFQTVTAGKFKRTLTPTKKVTREDMAKSKEDIESIFQLFKGWVAQNRPQLNIEEVATGETWFGPDALERGLCDEIKTVDDILLDYVDGGYSVYEVTYDPPPDVPSPLEFLFANEDGFPSAARSGNGKSLGRKAIRWLVQSFAEEVQGVLMDTPNNNRFSSSLSSTSIKDRFMARDDSSNRIRVSDEEFW